MLPFHSRISLLSSSPSRPQKEFHFNSKSLLTDHPLGVLALCLAVLLVFTGCATTLPKDVQRTPSTAFEKFDTTTTGRFFEEAAVMHPDESGFTLIRKERPAFTGRIAMIAMAEKTLDLQYYIWETDTTGWILALKLVAAADRGVRVRILVDDNNIANRDAPIAAIDAHPNIEIRTFNPLPIGAHVSSAT